MKFHADQRKHSEIINALTGDVLGAIERNRREFVPDYKDKSDDTKRLSQQVGDLLDQASKIKGVASSPVDK